MVFNGWLCFLFSFSTALKHDKTVTFYFNISLEKNPLNNLRSHLTSLLIRSHPLNRC